TVWVTYSAHRKGKHEIYARPIKLDQTAAGGVQARVGTEERITGTDADGFGKFLGPVMATGQKGDVMLACQSWLTEGRTALGLFPCKEGKWAKWKLSLGEAKATSTDARRNILKIWHPAIAASADGRHAVANDTYAYGDYDVGVKLVTGNDFVA